MTESTEIKLFSARAAIDRLQSVLVAAGVPETKAHEVAVRLEPEFLEESGRMPEGPFGLLTASWAIKNDDLELLDSAAPAITATAAFASAPGPATTVAAVVAALIGVIRLLRQVRRSAVGLEPGEAHLLLALKTSATGLTVDDLDGRIRYGLNQGAAQYFPDVAAVQSALTRLSSVPLAAGAKDLVYQDSNGCWHTADV
jgi:hypothetical protein